MTWEGKLNLCHAERVKKAHESYPSYVLVLGFLRDRGFVPVKEIQGKFPNADMNIYIDWLKSYNYIEVLNP